VTTGSSVATGYTHLWGVEADGVIPFTIDRGVVTYYGKFLVGARYLDLTDQVRISNILRLVADPSAFGYGAEDFTTHNEFAGPQLGTTLGMEWGRWSLEYTCKLAAGVTEQVRTISGGPLLSASVQSPLLVPGPLQAEPSNVGRERAPRGTLVPEISLRSKVAVTSWCSLTISYSLLYWNKILCPGDQMSPLVNVGQVPFQAPVPGSLDPKPLFNHTDYFAQGLDIGVEVRY
jgi:hypothetical protein